MADYTVPADGTLNTVVAALQASGLSHNTVIEVNGEQSSASTQTVSGITDNGYTLDIQEYGTQGHRHAPSSALRYDGSLGAAFTYSGGSVALSCNQTGLRLRGIQVRASAGYAHACVASGGTLDVANCVFDCNDDNRIALDLYAIGSNGSVKTSAILTKGTGIKTSGTAPVQACTIFKKSGGSGSSKGVQVDYGSSVLVNNLVLDFGTASSGASASSSNNCCTNASFGAGSSNQTSATASTEITNTGAGTEDLRINTSSAKAKDNGTSSGVPTDDMYGVTRTAPFDIGCTELAAAAVGAAFPRRTSSRRFTQLRMYRAWAECTLGYSITSPCRPRKISSSLSRRPPRSS